MKRISIARRPLSRSVRVPVPVKCGCVIIGVSDRSSGLPVVAAPAEPAVLVLIEDVQRLVAQLGELGAPPGPAAHGAVVQDRADDVDFLAVVYLIPEGLEHLADGRAVAVAPMHQARDVLEADVARLELLVIQHADAAVPRDLVAVEREVDLLDAVPLGRRAELRFRARGAAAEQNALGWLHRAIIASPCHPPGPTAPASLSKTSAARARPTACTRWSPWTRTADRSASPAGTATATTTIAGDRGSRPRARRGLPRRLPRARRAAARARAAISHRQRSRKDSVHPSWFRTALLPISSCCCAASSARKAASRRSCPPRSGAGARSCFVPAPPGLQEKTWPIETFFHKVVMLRNRLRTLEQHVNASDLPDDVKVKLQSHVSGCYGSLTSFNVLFADEEDHFKGSGGE